MNSFYLSRNSEGAMRGNQFVAVLDNTNELRNFSLTTQQRKFFICSFEYLVAFAAARLVMFRLVSVGDEMA